MAFIQLVTTLECLFKVVVIYSSSISAELLKFDLIIDWEGEDFLAWSSTNCRYPDTSFSTSSGAPIALNVLRKSVRIWLILTFSAL